jgi:ABC-type polysaccharide/polyol phosphate transport system ATPase subunit
VVLQRPSLGQAPALPAALAISVQDLEKTYRTPREAVSSLRDRVVHPLRKREFDILHPLAGVSFDVERGEFFGIVGRNGSGKSTLLRCLAGIYHADRGTARVNGRTAAFIELGGGFDQELSAEDNALITAILLGLSPAEARARVDEIFAFAELEEARQMRLKNYSSGMLVRLAFSTIVAVDADVILLDEVLAVGDAGFREKCVERFELFKREGRTVVLVTHSMDLVERHCDRALLLHDGKVQQIGGPEEIARAYFDVNQAMPV